MRSIPLEGRRFGSLVVLRKHDIRRSKPHIRKRIFWICQCDCGKTTSVCSDSLLRNGSRSCGCGRRVSHFKHGKANRDKITGRRNQAYSMWVNARQRAKHKNLPFSVNLEDIKIPAICPVLGIPLLRAKGGFSDTSPTLDEIVRGNGYVPGNVAVISYRANRLKSDGTPEELRKILMYVEGHVKSSFDEADFGAE